MEKGKKEEVTQKHHEILKWCRAHDWGENAELATGFGRVVIRGLRNENQFPPTKTLPADYSVIRAWAGY